MTDFAKLYDYNEKAAADGVWVKFDEGSAEFKIASAKDKDLKKRAQIMRRNALEKAKDNPDFEDDFLRDAVKNLYLKDWKGVFINGEELGFTPANVNKLLAYDEVLVFIAIKSQSLVLFQDELIEKDEKN